MDITAKIKALCEERDITTKELLKKAQLSFHVIDDWEKNTATPSFPALLQICKVLEIPLEDLFQSAEPQLTASQRKFLKEWQGLSDKEQIAIKKYMSAMQFLSQRTP